MSYFLCIEALIVVDSLEAHCRGTYAGAYYYCIEALVPEELLLARTFEAPTVVDSLEWRRWCPITGAFEASGR